MIPDNGQVFLRRASRLARRASRRLRRLPLAARLIVGAAVLVVAWAIVNGVVQVIRKPAEVFAVSGSFAKVPEVHVAATVSGPADAILHIVARDVRDLERALERVRDETANIAHTNTSIVLSRLINRYEP